MKVLPTTSPGHISSVILTQLERQVIDDLNGFDSKVSTDDAISQLKSLYPELVPFHHPHPDDAFWDYVRTQRD